MFCSSCGKEIPQVSRFCMFCGVNFHEQMVFTDKQPYFIKHTYLDLIGPIQKNTYNEDMYGFKFGFSLSDNEDKPTRADGKAILKIRDAMHLNENCDPFRFEFEFNKHDFNMPIKGNIFLCVFQRIELIIPDNRFVGGMNIGLADITLALSNGLQLKKDHIWSNI